MRDDTQLKTFAADIASQSWQAMNQAYRDYLSENQGDKSDDETDEDVMQDCEINLYVYSSGQWTIDHAQYLQDHRNIVAVIPLMRINGPMELAEVIEQDYDDEGMAD